MKLLVLVLRGLQASALGPYGNRWIDTPTCDALAAGGVVFDWHFAAVPDRAGFERAWRTGRYHLPTPQGDPPPAAGPDLLATLQAHGVATRLILDAPGPAPAGWGSVVQAEGLEASLRAAREALAETASPPGTLMWLEVSALLPPWRVPTEFVDPYFAAPAVTVEEEEEDEEEEEEVAAEEDEEEEEEPLDPIFDPPTGPIEEDDDVILAIQTTYAAAVSWVDHALGQLLGELPDDVAVLLTADHGQALGEHLVVGPVRPWLYEEIVHAPLLLYGPGWRAGRRVAALTQSVDLGPTLADFFGVSLEAAHGHSLLPLLGLEERHLRDYACMGLRVGDAAEHALRTRDWALLMPAGEGAARLYAMPEDRCQVNDVAQHHLEHADGLAGTLRAVVAASAAPGPLVPPPLPAEEQEGQ
jgi:arylsulfatase A-like enzyme